MKRVLLALALLLALAPPASATWANITCGAAESNNGTIDVTINSGSADLIVVAVETAFANANGAGQITDSQSNAYTVIASASTTTFAMWYKQAPSNNSSLVVHAGNNGAFGGSVAACAFTGSTGTGTVDTSNANSNAGTSTTTGSITPAQVHDLVVTAVRVAATGQSPAVTNSFSAPTIDGSANGSTIAIAWQDYNSVTALNPTWSWASGVAAQGNIGAFAPGGGGPATPGCKNGLVLLGAGCEDDR